MSPADATIDFRAADLAGRVASGQSAVGAAVADGARSGWGRRLSGVARFWVGALFCLTPVTAVLTLGWLTRALAREVATPRSESPNWLAGAAADRGWRRWLGGLWDTLRAGASALAAFAAGAWPFMALWLASWLGGWENSFNKGYEQSWVGPSLGLLGVAIALPMLSRWPMAMAHHAATGRIGAAWSAEVSGLIRAAGWRYVGLCLLFALAAAPLFLARGAAVFVEGWSPGFAARNADEIAAFAGLYRLVVAVYLVWAALFLRRRLGRLYARAAGRVAGRAPSRGSASLVGRALRGAALWAIWFALVAQIYVGQFLNHDWALWLNHPLIGLPWVWPMG